MQGGLERLLRERGLNVVGWRKVLVDNSMLGQDPVDSEPITEQIFVMNSNAKIDNPRSFDRGVSAHHHLQRPAHSCSGITALQRSDR